MSEDLKNHVAIVLDVSSSMGHLTRKMQTVFNNQIESLRKKSLLFEQETRVSVYTFSYSDNIKCLISDVDVARPMNVGQFRANGATAMLDAVGLAVEDLKMLPQKYGNHAFIVYLLTDGEENDSDKYNVRSFQSLLSNLPKNFTMLGFAPDRNGLEYLKGFGFASGNIEKWDTTEKGMEDVGRRFERSMDSYFTMRAAGTMSSSTLFSDLSEVKRDDAVKILNKVDPKNYTVLYSGECKSTVEIKDLVVAATAYPYVKGKAYYELVKNETVQKSKAIAIRNKITGEVFAGAEARALLNLPDTDVKLNVKNYGEWDVFVQSMSVNRKIIPNQRVLVFK